MATSPQLIKLLERGDELSGDGKIEQALQAYTQVWDAQKHAPQETGSLAGMAAYSIVDMYLDADEPRKAAEWTERLLTARAPKDTSSLIAVGRVWLALGDEKQALEYFGQAFDFGNKRAFQGHDPQYLAWYLKHSGKKAK
jgi:tetratricopeptide (TPR) repeat protein